MEFMRRGSGWEEEVWVFLIGTVGRGPYNESNDVVAGASAANRVRSMAQ